MFRFDSDLTNGEEYHIVLAIESIEKGSKFLHGSMFIKIKGIVHTNFFHTFDPILTEEESCS